MIYMIYSSWDIEQNILKLVILGHPLPFYPNKNPKIKILKKEKICWRYLHFTHVHQKSESYDVQFLQYRVGQAELFVTLGHFLPFQPPDNLEDENFKIEKTPADIIILHICTMNDNHMMHDSWDMECNRQNFLSSWTIFCPFTLLGTQKIKILKKWTTHLKILSFYKWVIPCQVMQTWTWSISEFDKNLLSCYNI